MLISSHLLAEIAQTVDQVVIINRGRALAIAPLTELSSPSKTLEDTYLELIAREAA